MTKPTAINNTSDPIRSLKYAEAAELLRVNVRTIHRRVAANRYQTHGTGTGRRILYSSIVEDIQRGADA